VSIPKAQPAGSHSAVASPPDLPTRPIGAPPTVAPYHPPPAFPPPGLGRAAPTDGRAITSLAASILGVLLGVPFGLPGLALGPLGYFMGRAAVARIDSEPGTSGGRSVAAAGWVLGIVATAIGAVVTLAWLVLLLTVISTPTTFE
jgi:hypothetical protein